MAKLPRTQYEALLKEPLVCFHCKAEQKNMPTLKTHLQQEWERLKRSTEAHKKRKLELGQTQGSPPPSEPAGQGNTSPARKKSKGDKS
jgi:aprataxin